MNTFKSLLDKVVNYETELMKKDSKLKGMILFELLYSEIVNRTSRDIEALLYINKYLLNNGLDLKLIKTSRGDEYFTINGGQFICSVKVPQIVIYGRVFRENIDNETVDFKSKNNIVSSLIEKEDLKKSDADNAYKYIFDEIVKDEIDKLFCEENKILVDDLLLRNDIIFQAKWNGIENVKKLLS